MTWYWQSIQQCAHLQRLFNRVAYKGSPFRVIATDDPLPMGPPKQPYKVHHMQRKQVNCFPRGKAVMRVFRLEFSGGNIVT